MLEFASSFFMQNKCYICGKNIGKEKYLCMKCYLRLDKYNIINNRGIKFEKRYGINIDYLFIFNYEKYIRKLILAYKFFDKSYLGKVFTEFIIRNKKVCEKLKSYDIIIPVPMSKRNKKLRGYNQTEIITNEISKSIGITNVSDGLIKVKQTKKQSSLNKEARFLNIKDAYIVNDKYKTYLKNKKIIIFDDIYTTGATINECLELVLKYDVKEILILILAKD